MALLQEGQSQQPQEPSDPVVSPVAATAGKEEHSTPEKAGLVESTSLREQGSEDPPKRKRLGWGQGLARLQSKDTKLSGALLGSLAENLYLVGSASFQGYHS